MNKSIENVIAALNSALAADPKAIAALLEFQVLCNQALADHPTVIVKEEAGQTTVSPLGLLNGVIEPATGYRVATVRDDSGKLLRFEVYQM